MAASASSARRRRSGFALIEVMIGVAILAAAMLAHGAGMISHRALAADQSQRSRGLIAAHQFMERLRADDDWAGLYARCRLRLTLPPVPETSTVANGRTYWTAATFYPDFQDRVDLRASIDVPSAPDVVTTLPVLREDASEAQFLLPMDLDGDGVIDDQAKDASYRFLPAVVYFLWEDEEGRTRAIRLTTLLRGDV